MRRMVIITKENLKIDNTLLIRINYRTTPFETKKNSPFLFPFSFLTPPSYTLHHLPTFFTGIYFADNYVIYTYTHICRYAKWIFCSFSKWSRLPHTHKNNKLKNKILWALIEQIFVTILFFEKSAKPYFNNCFSTTTRKLNLLVLQILCNFVFNDQTLPQTFGWHPCLNIPPI